MVKWSKAHRVVCLVIVVVRGFEPRVVRGFESRVVRGFDPRVVRGFDPRVVRGFEPPVDNLIFFLKAIENRFFFC